MDIKEAIKVLKNLQAHDRRSIIEVDRKAIDTVVAELEKPTYMTEDVDDFAEWTAFMQWIYDPTDKCWFQKHSSETKTTTQLRELWEKRGEMKDFAKCFGEGCPLKHNCKRYSDGIGATDYFVAPMYNDKTKKCMNYFPNERRIK